MAEINCWKVIEPDSYYRSFISNDKRPDGRDFNTARPVSIGVGSIGTAEGSSTVTFGSTTVICGIKAEVGPPSLKSPNLGFVVPNVDVWKGSTPHSKDEGLKPITSLFLQSLLHDDSVLDLNTLCIKESKFVWCLYIDLICTGYDGNLTDACVMAMTAALINLKLPDVIYNEETETIKLEDTTHSIHLKNRPLSVTFGVYDNGVTLLDCNSLDESECKGEFSVVLSQDGDIITTRKSGSNPISSTRMEELIKKSAGIVKRLNLSLEEAL